jgi:hypothetical protein
MYAALAPMGKPAAILLGKYTWTVQELAWSYGLRSVAQQQSLSFTAPVGCGHSGHPIGTAAAANQQQQLNKRGLYRHRLILAPALLLSASLHVTQVSCCCSQHAAAARHAGLDPSQPNRK